MIHPGVELRNDWALRQYVGSIIAYLMRGGDRANARMNMNERGVPPDVQKRILEGRASLH